MTNQITKPEQGFATPQSQGWLMPVISIEQAIIRRELITRFTKSVMIEGTDYGSVPGSDRPTLLKPGAEKLLNLFGLAPVFEEIGRVEDWTGEQHNGEPFFSYRYRCVLYKDGMRVGEGIGSCNSWEKKYRYRTADRRCPECGKAAIKRSKYPPRNNPNGEPGWYCHDKSGGCGAVFDANDLRIVNQPQGQIPNPDACDLVNTIDKMAQKRALIAAVLIAVNASEFFTQDLDDYIQTDGDVIEGSARAVDNAQAKQAPKQSAPPAQKPNAQPAVVKPSAQPAAQAQQAKPQADDGGELAEVKRRLTEVANMKITVTPADILEASREAYRNNDIPRMKELIAKIEAL